MAEELRLHLEMRAEETIGEGVSPEEARLAAERRFGNVGLIQEHCRDQLVFAGLEHLRQDVRYAVRALRKNPGYTLVALLTLTFAIGVNSTAFMVLNRLLLRPLPYGGVQSLVSLEATSPDGPPAALSQGDFCDIRSQNAVFERVASFGVSWMTTLVEPGRLATRCDSMYVTAAFFTVLGVQPIMLGRAFTEADEAHHEHVVLLTHAFWVKHYGADPRVIGRPLISDGGHQSTIIGVMVPELDDPTLFKGNIDEIAFCSLMSDIDPSFRGWGWSSVIARLKPGVSAEEARQALTVIARRLEHDYPKTNTGRGFQIRPFETNPLDATGQRLVWLVMGLSGVVLLVASVNLANLQLVRTTARRGEIAIRLALGCTRARLIRMLLTESVLVSGLGGALGLLIAQWSRGYLEEYWNVDMPISLRVIGFTLVVSAAAGAFFGTIPALLASRFGADPSAGRGTRSATPDKGRHRLRQILIVVELGLALTLLAGAGYFVRGIQRITSRELGWRPDNLLIGYIALDHDHYGELRDPRGLAFGDRLLPALRALPGVDAAALSNDDVFDSNLTPFAIEGRLPMNNDVLAAVETPSPGYFKAYGMNILLGRDFDAQDRPDKPYVVIISQAMAQKYWPGENPVGKRIGMGESGHEIWSEIVGVASDILHDREWDPAPSRFALYFPWAQNSFRFLAITVHATGDPAGIKEEVRKAVNAIEPNVAMSYLDTAREIMAKDLLVYTLVRRALVQIAVLGVLLAAVGIYGVIANLASERTKEIGIRMALGAQSKDVLWLFLAEGLWLALLGTLIGLMAGAGLVKVLDHLILGFPGGGLGMVGAVALLLAGIAVLASWLPARGATRVNPIQALRAE